MATVTQFVFPASEVALADTFDRLPEAQLAVEQSVATCKGESYGLWITASDREAVCEALEDDPSVREFQQLADEDHRWLFDVEFWPTVQLLRSILLCDEGVITDIVGRDGQWVVTCRYTDHASLCEVSDLLDERNFTYDVLRVHNDSEATSEGTVLTEEQHQALEHACQEGYFEVPRGVTLEELADDLDISHQALSERLRRATGSLVDSTLATPEDAD